jgi:surface protein
MEYSNNTSKENNEKNESAKPNPIIDNIKSVYFLEKLYDNIQKKKKLEIAKYNKRIQNKLNLSVKDYKEYSETLIEIEIIPVKGKYGEFIKVDENDKLYYNIYFNDNKEKIKNKYKINEEDKVTKIKIIIDYQVKSFKDLFYECKCIESINFKKFYRNNITDMSGMFFECSSLKELNLTNFNTNNVTNMSRMFEGCSSLKELNLTNFNTNNVSNMCSMFKGCSSLKELNLTNFNTNNVTNMLWMFEGCSSLKELNLNNFNNNNVTNMSSMFSDSLEDLI